MTCDDVMMMSLSSACLIGRGVRQGCSVSHLLYFM